MNEAKNQQNQLDQNQWSALEAELTTLEKANSSLSLNFEKIKNEKEKLKNENSVLLKSDLKFRQIRDNLAMKICQMNPGNEDLESLLQLEPFQLVSKFENLLKGTKADQIDLTESEDNETITDLKVA